MPDQPQCTAIIRDGLYGKRECTNKASVERDGQWVCGVHDPVAIQRRMAARLANHRATSAEQDERYRRVIAEHEACRGVATEDLRPGLLAELLAAREGQK